MIGPGRLGGALALALDRAGWPLDSIVYRSNRPAASAIADAMATSVPGLIAYDELRHTASPLIIIASADPEIAVISKNLSRMISSPAIVLHTSGSLSSDVLGDLKRAGCDVGSMHPLVSVSDAFLGADRFRGAYFCIEGGTRAVDAATEIANAVGAKPFSIETRFKPLYHAAAVTASGHIVTVFDMAIELLSACEIDRETARTILMPLVASTVENLRTQEPAAALTGTFARADVEAFERHLSAMTSAVAKDSLRLYLEIAERSVRLAETHGADAAKTAGMRERISIAKRNLG